MTVKVNINIDKKIRGALEQKRTKERVGNQVINDMKASLAKGISPVRGERRFPAYKDPKRYPRDLKPRRPVNLYLSGDMLAALKFKPLSGTGVSIGITDREQARKAKAHQTGDGVPKRRFVPTEKGEEFTVTITRRLRDLYASIIYDIIKRNR